MSDYIFNFGVSVEGQYNANSGETIIPLKENLLLHSTLQEKLLAHDDFEKDEDGNMGTHSSLKYVVLCAIKCGSLKQWIYFHGRWKEKGQQGVYFDFNLP